MESENIDLALVLDYIAPGAKYIGSLSAVEGKTQEEIYNAIEWEDGQVNDFGPLKKPGFQSLQLAWAEMQRKNLTADMKDFLNDQFNALPVPVRAKFAPLKAAINLELQQGHYSVVEAIIDLAEVPPELEETKATLLEAVRARLR